MTQELTRLIDDLRRQEASLREGGGAKAVQRQHEKGRFTARERIARLIDPSSAFHELGLWAAWGMYREWGGAPSAGVVTGIGTVSDRRVMIVANDATVKAGGVFSDDVQESPSRSADRAGVEATISLPCRFGRSLSTATRRSLPDEDDFGRIFRNNAISTRRRRSATGSHPGQLCRGRRLFAGVMR
jgi:acetyl-CoA carboxylase carboxyltransferase component